MRLERLEISGFGRLDDLCLDLSPQITVVLGANESGKSTVHRAVRAALYGIDAGGQGRAAQRSEWARWRPWEGNRYGVVLTYNLADGRRFRVARRLEQREERVQVQELGGRDVTDALRSGRIVTPGLHHLGIDEAVFAASASIGEEGLETSAPDGPSARAESLQEAIERLADAAGRATAAEALGRLRQAMDRVGTENRSKSPLGLAGQRLHAVEEELARARERVLALASEEQRREELEGMAAAAEERCAEVERAWLEGRLAQLSAHRRELADAALEIARLHECIAEWQAWAGFPLEREERVSALGVELRLALDAEVAARRRWDAAREETRICERRRLEIATAVRALGSAPRVSDADLNEAAALQTEVSAEGGTERRVAAVVAAGARLDGLHREAAAMGLGAVPLGSVDTVAGLIEEARGLGAIRHLRPLAGAAAVVAVAVTVGTLAAHLPILAVAAGAGLLLAAALLLAAERLAGGPAAAARRRLARLCPGLDLSPAGLERAAERLPWLRALHADLHRQEAAVEGGRAELAEASERLAGIATRCLVLAARIPVEVDAPEAPPLGPAGHLARARQALEAVARAADAGRRRAQLEAEDARLAERLDTLRALAAEAERCASARTDLASEMARLCDIPGLPAEADPALQVAAFRQAASTRRQLEAARARLVEVSRRVSALGPADDTSLERQAERLAGELRQRGGDPDAVRAELPRDPGHLHDLEVEAQDARRHAGALRTQATGMRERLAGIRDGLPSVADLEDERAACVAVRDRCLHQLQALRHAAVAIEAAARRVHRDAAPRLAAAVARNLALITDGRYEEVHVDPERFAVTLRSPDRLELIGVELLSHGTRDQVALLLRVALAEVLGEGGEPVPLLLDDPLQSSDPLRRTGLLDFLLRLSERIQVVLATSDPAVAEAVLRSGAKGTVVELGRRSSTSRSASGAVPPAPALSRGRRA
jgi:recombinational DNA repair ATPase RecF